jgi:7-cyano-7-deazaguanine synthase
MKVVVLLSGGIDSVTAMHHVAVEHSVVCALSFRYGAKHHDRELPMAAFQARALGIPHRVVEIPFIGAHFKSTLLAGGEAIPKGHYEEETMRQTVVPFRNGIMLAIAGGYAESAGADALVIAAHAGDHAVYPDCREDFMRAMGDALRLGTYVGVRLLRPFVQMDKTAIVRRGAELGVDFSHTWSCYEGRGRHCGECGTCVERREAFQLAGIEDPTEYESNTPLPPKPAGHH